MHYVLYAIYTRYKTTYYATSILTNTYKPLLFSCLKYTLHIPHSTPTTS